MEFHMAIDRDYQALPEPCQLLEQAKLDLELGESLPFLLSCFRSKERLLQASPIEAQLVQEVLVRHPGIEKRYYDVGRRQGSLLYFLSEDHRHGRVGMSSVHDMGSKITNGASALPEHLRSGQGIPLRYSSAIEVQEMANYLGGITAYDLRRVYNPQHMEAQAVYKFSSDQAEQEWKYICRAFEGLKAFYIEVATHQEGVLVVDD
jgi:hypothetical protein